MGDPQELPPVRCVRMGPDDRPLILVTPKGQPGWVMTPAYARETAALLLGAALAVESMDSWEAIYG